MRTKIMLRNLGDLIDFLCCVEFYKGTVLAEEDGKIIKFTSKKISMDSLSNPFVVMIDTGDKREEDDFYDYVSRWKVEE